MNPEYQKARHAKMIEAGICRSMAEYQKHRKEERRKAGKEISRAEYLREYRKRRKTEGRPLKQYPRSKETIRRWNESEKGKAAYARYMARNKGMRGNREHHETGDEYASRIIRELEEIYKLGDF